MQDLILANAPREQMAARLAARWRMADRKLSPGEQLVWATAYAQLIIAGNKPEDAARHATTYACSLRVIREQDVAARSGACGPSATMAAVEQMRGGR